MRTAPITPTPRPNTGPWRPDFADPSASDYPRGPVTRLPDPTMPRAYRLVSVAILGLVLWMLGEIGVYQAALQLAARGW